MQKLYLSFTCSISALADFYQLLSIAGLIYSVFLLATHAVAAVWLPKSRRHRILALGHFKSIAQKERKMGVLHYSSWTVLNA